jgi:MFS family permease
MDTSVNVAFPSITRGFGLAVPAMQWVVIAYMLVFGTLMLSSGKLGDLFSYRGVFRAGLAASALGFAICASAPTFGWLLGGRTLQGLGAALSLSCAPALVTAFYPESQRTRALSIYGALFAAGSAAGPLAGGALVDLMGWSGVFAFRVPIALAALALSWLLPAEAARLSGRPFDTMGAVLLSLWLSALLLALALPADVAGAWLPWALAACGVIGFAAFVRHESRTAEPILRLGLFRDWDFSLEHVANMAINMAGFAGLLLVPHYLVRIAGLTASEAGLVMAIGAAGAIAGSALAGWLVPRIGARATGLLALFLCAGALLGIASWQGSTPILWLLAGMVPLAGSLGLFQVAYTDSVTAALPVADRGVAGSLALATRTVGIVGGAAGLSTLYQHLEQQAIAARAVPDAALLTAFSATFLTAGVALAAFAIATLLFRAVRPAAAREG